MFNVSVHFGAVVAVNALVYGFASGARGCVRRRVAEVK